MAGTVAGGILMPLLQLQRRLKPPEYTPPGVYYPQRTFTYGENGETVEWINSCLRKVWRVYLRRLEKWIQQILQPPIDRLVQRRGRDLVQRVEIAEFELDFEPPVFRNMSQRGSRKDSDISGVVDVRYTGGARALLLLELGKKDGKLLKLQLPIQVKELDVEGRMWIKARLAPLSPYVGTLSFAFVGPPSIRVQLLPYNRVQLMNIPIIKNFLTQLLTVDLPGLMVLPNRLEIDLSPSVTAVAEAAVGRDVVMQAVASAVMQVEAVEQSLEGALPLERQEDAGGFKLPETFVGELTVSLREARGLPVWGLPGSSNPYCQFSLGMQSFGSKRSNDTGKGGFHGNPVWNQDFQFLVKDALGEVLEVEVRDTKLTGKPDIGRLEIPLVRLQEGTPLLVWHKVEPPLATSLAAITTSAGLAPAEPAGKGHGELLLEITYKTFTDDWDSGDREYESYRRQQRKEDGKESSNDDVVITDVKTAAEASSRAGLAATKASQAFAVTRAATARAAVKAATAAREAITDRFNLSGDDDEDGDGDGEGAEPSAEPGKESKKRLADLPEVSEVTVSQVMVEVEERLSKQEKEDESLERRAVAKSERPWLQLVTILVFVTIVILSVVAWRLDLLLNFNIQPFGS